MYHSGCNPDLGERIESAYLCREVAEHREHLLKTLSPDAGEKVLDVGSGPGFLAADIARCVGPFGQVVGVDISEQMVAYAATSSGAAWLDFRLGDALSLPFNKASFDLVVSTQVVEYVDDVDRFCAEVARVVRPGGRVLISVTDWDGVNWHASNERRMKHVLKAFATHCAQRDLPRTLAPKLRAAGLEIDRVSSFPIVSLGERDGSYCQVLAAFVVQFLLSAQVVPSDLVGEWLNDLHELKRKKECFFSVNRYDFLARKAVDADGWSKSQPLLH